MTASVLAFTIPACAQDHGPRNYDLPSQALGDALETVTEQAGFEFAASEAALHGKRAPALKGRYTIDEAVHALLAGSALRAEIKNGAVLIVGRSEPSEPKIAGSTGDQTDIIVTGSRIRGAPATSPVKSLTHESIREAGQNDIGDAIRSLPQSFAGGQNPGVAPGAVGASNQNTDNGSSINLRGLGPDATLTLLNGHRLAYGGFSQAIDVNTIPLDVVDRIEIVADGASALYGSDAVGGVANIILKKDYSGFSTTARLGAATSGGDEQQQYTAVGGTTWATGGFIAALNFERDTSITARERSYTDYMADDATLLPPQKQYNALISGHQSLGPNLTLSLDAMYSDRRSNTVLDIPGSARYTNSPHNKSLVIAPTIKIALSPQWSAALTGAYGRDRTETKTRSQNASGMTVSQSVYCYCNSIKSIEANAEGPLFRLPGGDARIAVGTGYRYSGFLDRSTASSVVISSSRNSYYGYGEAYLPFISSANGISGVERLSISAAIRYEEYPGLDHVATPKFGIIYSPSADLDLKGSWGKSFKAPTLIQQFQPQYAYLYDTTTLGGSGYPANSTALLTFGGNKYLKPERATTWTGTVDLHPRAIDGARLEVSYFHIDYRDRVTQPIQGTNFYTTLTGNTYQDFYDTYPSAQLQADTLAVSSGGFYNYSTTTYTPANVVALVHDTYLNAARQKIQGVDVSAEYGIDIAPKQKLKVTAAGAWLNSTQTLTTTLPTQQLAGTIFNPPHFRGRAGADWTNGVFNLSAYVNYTGSVKDTRSKPYVRVGSQTTVDVAALYRGAGEGLFGGIDISFSIRNLLNATPAYARPVATYYVNYDSTNYSAIGRFVSVSITKHW